METEIKTLVYRDRAKQSVEQTAKKRHTLNKKLAAIAAALFAVVVTAAVLFTVRIIGNSNADVNANEQIAEANSENENAESNPDQGLIYAASSIYGDVKTDETAKALNTDISMVCLEQDGGTDFTVPFKKENFEENIILKLLADITGEEEDEFMYIPATLGRDDVEPDIEDPDDILAFENDITAASDSRLEAVAEVASILAGPDDVPGGLNYTYNTDMMLDLSAHEIEVLERIVEAEATGMTVYGKMLVANVVINRVNSKYFANDVESVVTQKIGGSYQFAPIRDGRYYSVSITDTTREAVARVLDGEDYSEGALYFFERSATSKSKATWFDKNLKFLFKFGAHEFFTEYKK